MSAPAPGRGESGQVLILALLALLLASIGAAFVAEDIALRERALRDEMLRARLRGLVDAAMADALGRLATHQAASPGAPFGGGEIGGEREWHGSDRAVLRVWASYAGRRAAAVAEVYVPVEGPPTILTWQRLPSAAVPPE